MNDKPQYDNELRGRLWMQSSQNPRSPIAKFELTINGELKKFVVWQEQVSKTGNAFHRVEIDKPKEGGNYANSPKPTSPTPAKSQWPSGHGPSVYIPSPQPKQENVFAAAVEADDIPF